ncbi:ead/Ea22-like family protein [Escherichia coli]|uniref:ead/Ea22-like family protein n=1 Tax=Escherichia coli TaxID=562 RepID=UPI00111B8D9E|nr:ead/Ea22-like family protein [Escherichia coli]EJD5478550.1 ead/Ea22-like family protein [Escherichia coli]EJM9807934.1 ead/Ea22-like family protein [Escherichia coli]EJT2527598.1 ead/Ea22-like family protein [Escherichia coli]EJZ1364535.1 ead/Ea22-like family protein [Escherichia coli]
MSKIDYQKLREIAEKTKIAGEAPVMPFDQRINALNDFMKHFSPDIALALLDEREAKDKVWSAQDNHINQQADRIESLEKKNDELGRSLEAAEKRIAELEAREVQLPTRYDLRYGHPINADERHVMIPKENGSWLYLIDLEHALRVADIRIKGE